jgi:hypothetical protein
VRFFDSRQRGYTRAEATPARLHMAFQGIADPLDDGSALRTVAAFVVEAGRPDLERA